MVGKNRPDLANFISSLIIASPDQIKLERARANSGTHTEDSQKEKQETEDLTTKHVKDHVISHVISHVTPKDQTCHLGMAPLIVQNGRTRNIR